MKLLKDMKEHVEEFWLIEDAGSGEVLCEAGFYLPTVGRNDLCIYMAPAEAEFEALVQETSTGRRLCISHMQADGEFKELADPSKPNSIAGVG